MPNYILPKLEILRTGEHIGESGELELITQTDLQQLASNYDPISNHEAFICIGHTSDPLLGSKEHDRAPAMGWIKRLWCEGDKLFAKVNLVEEAADWIRRGLYKYRSICFYPANSPISPVPGQKYVRHLALLGASPPAIKGLTPLIQFTEQEVDLMTTRKTKKAAAEDKPLVEVAEDQSNSITESADTDEPKAYAEPDGDSTADTDSETDSTEGAEDADADTDNAEFLNDNVTQMLAYVLSEGEKGYKGEISSFSPVPSEDNNWLYNADEQEFKGQFTDNSIEPAEVFNFTIEKSGDGWVSSYANSNTEAGDDLANGTSEANVDDAESELANEPAEDADEQEPKALGEKPSPISEQDDSQLVMQGEMEEMGESSECACQNENYELGTNEASAEDARIAQLEAQVQALTQLVLDKQRAEFSAYAENVYAQTKLLPGQMPKEAFVAFCEALAKQDTKPEQPLVAFSESAKQEPNLLGVFRAMLELLPPQVAFGEMADKDVDSASPEAYDNPAYASPDAEALAKHSKAMAYCKANQLDPSNAKQYMQAVKAIS